MRRCDHCDLPVNAGCGCSLPQKTSPNPAKEAADSGFPAGAILISRRRVAHRPGCTHQSDSEIAAPVWGWILDPDPQLWRRISEGTPAHATHGNTQRYAVKRCQSCDT
ncbi:MAG: hypothetical protein M0026_17350 [Nocardiopsaceae bacterium]|nr:hypothetical protein [Nocardiopsaceae bacterium]